MASQYSQSLPPAVDKTMFQVNDRRSNEEFMGLAVMNDICDATTHAFFRERLRKAGAIDEPYSLGEGFAYVGTPEKANRSLDLIAAQEQGIGKSNARGIQWQMIRVFQAAKCSWAPSRGNLTIVRCTTRQK